VGKGDLVKTFIAFVGSLIGLAAAGGAGVLIVLPPNPAQDWAIFAGIIAGAMILLYLLGSIDPLSGFGAFCRGCLIGLNAGTNALVSYMLISLLSMEAGIVTAAVLGLLVWLSVFDPISRSSIYKGFLGWLNTLLPMSWPIIGLGLLLLIVNLLGYLLIGLPGVTFFRMTGVQVAGATGVWLFRGGWISNLNMYQTAFNMGPFVFVHNNSASFHADHESGHALNLGAFGSVFHLVGWLDEVLPLIGRGANAFAERLADSNDPSATNDIPIWNP
jgi:hypothetical protein